MVSPHYGLAALVMRTVDYSSPPNEIGAIRGPVPGFSQPATRPAIAGQPVPEMARADDTSFFLTWNDYQGVPVNRRRIAVQRFDWTGAQVGPVIRPDDNLGSQWQSKWPRVSSPGDGTMVVAWAATETLQTSYQYFFNAVSLARIYDATGTPLGPEFVVEPDFAAAYTEEVSARVASQADGSFAVATDGPDPIRTFDATGAPVAGPFSPLLTDHVQGMAPAPDGTYAMVGDAGPSKAAAYGRFDSDTGATLAAHDINDGDDTGGATNGGKAEAVDVNTLGVSAAVSISRFGANTSAKVLARVYDANGDEIGLPIRINTFLSDDLVPDRTRVAWLDDTTFVVLYVDSYWFPAQGTFAQRVRLTSEMPVLCGAAPEPAGNCAQADARKSKLKADDGRGDPLRQRMDWLWKGPSPFVESEFGDAADGFVDYRLCVYDSSGVLQPLSRVRANSGGGCRDRRAEPNKACWSGSPGKVYRYGDGAKHAFDGLTRLKYKRSSKGTEVLKIRLAGENLQFPTLPATLPMTVQFLAQERGGALRCWQAEYTAASRNDTGRILAKN